jgi:acyl-CoA reductase-like NAD-dependent aldehyde dehydrogenase
MVGVEFVTKRAAKVLPKWKPPRSATREVIPLPFTWFAELIRKEVRLPPGVLNVLHGSKETVESLITSIFTTNGKHAREFRRRIEAGNVGINMGVAVPIASSPSLK